MIAVHSASGQDRQTRHKQAQPIKARHSRSQRSPDRSTLCVLRCILRDGLRWMCCVAALLRTELRCPWASVRLEREHLAHRWRRADRAEALHPTDRRQSQWHSPSPVSAASLAQAPKCPRLRLRLRLRGVVRLRRGADLMHDTAQVVEALVADYDQPHALRRVPMGVCVHCDQCLTVCMAVPHSCTV